MNRWIYRYFRPISDDPDIYRKELVLNSMLGFCFLLFFVFQVLTIRHEIEGDSYIGCLYFLLTLFPFISSYYFSRTRRINTASIIFITTFTVGSFYGIMLWSVFLPATLLSLCLMTILTGILINSRASFIYAICVTMSLVIISTLLNLELIGHDTSWQNSSPSIGDSIEFGIFILFMSVVTWLSNRQSELDLKRARHSEHELRNERDTLELRVAERGKQLEQLQIEKISELYKFVEFGKLSSGLIHDLINPLNALCIEVENGKFQSDANLKVSMNSLVNTSHKIQNIIGSTRKHIQVNLKNIEFSIKDVIEETLLVHHHRLIKNRIEVKTNLLSGPKLLNSPSLLTHILTNLISNAIDAIEETQKKFISNSNNKKYYPFICISLTLKDKYAVITIKDNGQGIPPDIAENIFNPFFTTKNDRGCGYGLSASKHIAEKYFKGTLCLVPRNNNCGENNKNYNKTNKFKTAFELSLPLSLPTS